MRVLSLCLGRQMLEPDSSVLERQREYYRGWRVELVCLGTGEYVEKQVDQLRFIAPGGKNKLMAFFLAWKTARMLTKKYSYDVITCQDPQWTGLLSWLVNPRFRTPLQLQDHSGRFARSAFTLSEKVFQPFSYWLARHAKRIRTVSQRGKRGLQNLGIPEAQIDVIPVHGNTVQIEVHPIAKEKTTLHVLSVGRLEPEKGYDLLLKAWQQANLQDAKLFIAGSGSQQIILQNLAQQLGIASSIEFLGWLSGRELEAQWQAADLYVQPSFFEGWGRTLLEAAERGLAIVSTNVGLISEVLRPNQEVLICEVGDSEVFAHQIKRLVADAELRTILGKAAKKRAQDWQTQQAGGIEQVRIALKRCCEVE